LKIELAACRLLKDYPGKTMIIEDQVMNKVGIPLLKRMMNVTSTAQKLTAANIANVSVPGYQSKSIDFKSEMRAAMHKKKIELQVTNERHLPPAGQPQGIKIIKNVDDSNDSGVNNVDVDKEMASVAENQILYAYGSKMLMRKFNTLKSVIRGKM
jgi:flagellar basal-body rod protein FlgB